MRTTAAKRATRTPRSLRTALPGSIGEPLRTFSLLGKLMLASEIALTYLQARRWLRRREITETVALARLGIARGTLADDRSVGAEGSGKTALLGVRLGRTIERIFRVLPGDTRCLTRSIVLMRMLARREVDTTLVIGVRALPSFGAHAWIEHDGRPLLEPIEAEGRRLIEL